MSAIRRASSPCCECVEMAGMVATDFTRPRSVARQMRCIASNIPRAAAAPSLTRNDIRCP
jgi:hypothetical protein